MIKKRVYNESKNNEYKRRRTMYNTPMIIKGASGEREKGHDSAPEMPFEGRVVYYSGSIKGAPELEPNFAWQLVQYMGNGGADILSEHVAARNKAEMDEIRARRTGQEIQAMRAHPEPWFQIRSKDTEWVDEATHFVAVVNAPSHGVGMEIERAILKPARGLNLTPVLCLVHADLLESLSYMIRGVTPDEHPDFHVQTYASLDDAKDVVHAFLTGTLRNQYDKE